MLAVPWDKMCFDSKKPRSYGESFVIWRRKGMCHADHGRGEEDRLLRMQRFKEL